MKQLLFLLISISLFLPLVNLRAATAEVDQACDLSSTGIITGLNGTNYQTFQTFTPSYNRLSKVTVFVNVEGLSAANVGLRVYHGRDLLIDAGSKSVPIAPPHASVTYTFADQVMIPGDNTYRISLSSTGTVNWYITSDSCYSGGTAYKDGNVMSPRQDYGFKTYGWNDGGTTPPTDPGTNNETPVADSSSTVNNNSEAALADSPDLVGTASILPPKEVKAVDVPSDEGGLVLLTWKKSDTKDIDGYKIYRSTEPNKGFKEIGKATKDKLKYIDSSAELDKVFYYFSRSYRGSELSNSSDVVNTASKDNLGPKIPTKFKITLKSETEINFTWTKNTETDLGGYVLVVYNPKDKGNLPIENITIEKEQNNYKMILSEHTRLKSNTSYDFSLQAKDTHENLSSKTRLLSGSFGKAKSGPKLWYAIGAGVLVLASAGVLLYIHFRKKSTQGGSAVGGNKIGLPPVKQ